MVAKAKGRVRGAHARTGFRKNRRAAEKGDKRRARWITFRDAGFPLSPRRRVALHTDCAGHWEKGWLSAAARGRRPGRRPPGRVDDSPPALDVQSRRTRKQVSPSRAPPSPPPLSLCGGKCVRVSRAAVSAAPCGASGRSPAPGGKADRPPARRRVRARHPSPCWACAWWAGPGDMIPVGRRPGGAAIRVGPDLPRGGCPWRSFLPRTRLSESRLVCASSPVSP